MSEDVLARAWRIDIRGEGSVTYSSAFPSQRVNKRTCARSALEDSLKRSFPGISSSAERIASISARRVLSLLVSFVPYASGD